MSPVSPREREVSPPPTQSFSTGTYSQNRNAADKLLNEYKTAFPKTSHFLAYEHECSSSVKG